MRIRTALIPASLFDVALVSGCGTSTPTQTALPDSHQTYSEYLVFKGQLRGTLTVGINAQGVQHAQPYPGAHPKMTQQPQRWSLRFGNALVRWSWQMMLLAFAIGQYLWLSRSGRLA